MENGERSHCLAWPLRLEWARGAICCWLYAQAGSKLKRVVYVALKVLVDSTLQVHLPNSGGRPAIIILLCRINATKAPRLETRVTATLSGGRSL